MRGNADSEVMRLRLEDAEEQELQRHVSRLAAKLHVGANYVGPEQFRQLVYFYVEDADERLECFDRGSFKVMRLVEVIRESRPGAFKTIAVISREIGIDKETLRRWVSGLKLMPRMRGTRKLYDIEQLRDAALKNSSRGRTGLR